MSLWRIIWVLTQQMPDVGGGWGGGGAVWGWWGVGGRGGVRGSWCAGCEGLLKAVIGQASEGRLEDRQTRAFSQFSEMDGRFRESACRIISGRSGG